MSNTIRIKRRASGASGAPSSLENAELAFNEVDDTLYYGKGTGGSGGSATAVIAIGGEGHFAVKNSPTFTGTPSGPTAAVDTNTTQLATTAFVVGQASATAPLALNSTAVTGTSLRYARADHRHIMPRLDEVLSPTADVNLNNRKITNLATPTAAGDAATKGYVDAAIEGLQIKGSVRVATTANITLSGTQTIDGVSVVAGNRVLVKNQSTASQNGIYVVAAGGWTRSDDMNIWDEVPGAFVIVEQGTTQADTSWLATSDRGGTLGTTAITFVQFQSGSDIVAGNGLNRSGNTLSVVSANSDRIVVSASGVDLATIGDIAGTYRSVTVDVYGRVTAGTNPTTLAGYGITDALSNSTTSTQNGYFGDIFLRDDTNPSHYMGITCASDLTANRTFSINPNNADRTLSMSGNLTVSAAATVSGTNTGDQTITLTGDVTGSGTGSFATTIANNAVTNAKFRQGAALSVVGVTGNATANVADIAAGTDGHVLRRAGTALGFGTIATAGIANGAVTLEKQANMATASVVYRKSAGAGAPEVQTLATLKTDLGLTGTNTGDQTITLTGDVTGSGTGSFATTLANSGVEAGTYNGVATQVRPFTVDSKGRLTSIGTAVTITPAWGSITSVPAKLTAIAGLGTPAADTLDFIIVNPAGNVNILNAKSVGIGVVGATTAGDARTAMGLGTIATQNANNVNITGGTVSNLTLTSCTIDGGTF